jgi:hypothetical protein
MLLVPPTMIAPLVADMPFQPSATACDDDVWQALLSTIEARRIIPILGRELPRVDTDSGSRRLCEWVAEKVAMYLDDRCRLLRAALAPRMEREGRCRQC